MKSQCHAVTMIINHVMKYLIISNVIQYLLPSLTKHQDAAAVAFMLFQEGKKDHQTIMDGGDLS